MAARKNPRLRMLHIRDEIDSIEVALRGISFSQFQESFTLRRAVERAVQTVSEATKALPGELRGRHPAAPWNAIIGVGNILRHEYQRVDEKVMWEIVTVHFPQLRPIVLAMLAEIDIGS
jgi:uncharacterized protein with HEPN domain